MRGVTIFSSVVGAILWTYSLLFFSGGLPGNTIAVVVCLVLAMLSLFGPWRLRANGRPRTAFWLAIALIALFFVALSGGAWALYLDPPMKVSS